MINIKKQIQHWQKSALEDLKASQDLVQKKHIRQSLFFAHLSLEKILKAHVCKQNKDLAPRTHNLLRLLELCGLTTDENNISFLAEMNQYNIEGRYPEIYETLPSLKSAGKIINKTSEVFKWLRNQL